MYIQGFCRKRTICLFIQYALTHANKNVQPIQKCLGCIPHDLLPSIISKCRPPIGLKGIYITSSRMMNIVKDLRIPIRYGKVKLHLCPWSMSRL